jgi:NAD+ kinase
MKTIEKIGIIANLEKQNAPEMIGQVLEQVRSRGLCCASESSMVGCCDLGDIQIFPSPAELARNVDLLVVIGGDGTMLRVARQIAGTNVPLLGINAGRLGFLTQITSDQIERAFDQLESGEYELESRCLLSGEAKIGPEEIHEIALNDFVLSRGIKSRMIELEVFVDDQFVARYFCDGLVISTPTGSTAYSLAAGAGIIIPNAEVFSISPICPHSFQNRTVVVNNSSTIVVKVRSEKLQTILSVDGQEHFPMNRGDVIICRRSEKKIFLVRFPGTSFFSTLREKLQWAG